VSWTAPGTEGSYELSVAVTDSPGLSTQASTKVLVKSFAPTPGDLIADYPFTGNADDVSGNALHGSPNGAVPTADLFGIPLQAYYFNGGSQHIAVANHPLLNFQNGITVSCWFRAAALPEKETFLLSHGSWQNRWKISLTPEKRLRWTVNTLSAVGDLDSPFPLVPDSFYHVSATYADGFMALYLNGELVSHRSLSGLLRTTTTPFLMGQMLPGETAYNFKGVIDAVKIFNHALIPVEVAAYYLQETTEVRDPLAVGHATLSLHPNPAQAWIRIGSSRPLDHIRVYDLAGRLVREQTDTSRLDVSRWPSGMYVVVGYSGSAVCSQRFVK
jgi:hypothetical protein